MNGRLQQQINPVTTVNTKTFNHSPAAKKKEEPSQNQVDFKSVLLNSNADVALQRAAKKNGDLSTAESYEDFLNQLTDQTRAERMPRTTLNKDDFLKLFVTQLQNQDPLKPKDGTEMAAQLAQFNALEQMMNVNTTLERMESADETDRGYRFIDYVGKSITLGDGRARLEDGQINTVEVEFKVPATSAMLKVLDSSGKQVATRPLGPKDAGSHEVHWDGKSDKGEALPNGLYTLAVEGNGKGGFPIESQMKTRVKVEGLDLRDPNASFHTPVGKVALSDVIEIGDAKQSTPSKPPPPKAVDELPEGGTSPAPVKPTPTPTPTPQQVSDPIALPENQL